MGEVGSFKKMEATCLPPGYGWLMRAGSLGGSSVEFQARHILLWRLVYLTTGKRGMLPDGYQRHARFPWAGNQDLLACSPRWQWILREMTNKSQNPRDK